MLMPQPLKPLQYVVTMPGTNADLQKAFPGKTVITLTEVIAAMNQYASKIVPVVNPTMAPYGGFTGIPGVTSTAAELAAVINHGWFMLYGGNYFRPITVDEAAQYLPGNPSGPRI